MGTTYREAIQRQQKALQEVYDNAEGLRDAATEGEKLIWNSIRGLMDTSVSLLYRFDNSLSPERAASKLKGDYVISANPKK